MNTNVVWVIESRWYKDEYDTWQPMLRLKRGKGKKSIPGVWHSAEEAWEAARKAQRIHDANALETRIFYRVTQYTSSPPCEAKKRESIVDRSSGSV